MVLLAIRQNYSGLTAVSQQHNKQFTKYPVQRTKNVCAHHDVKSSSNWIWNRIYFKSTQTNMIQYNWTVVHDTLFNEVKSKWLLPRYSCWCSLIDERVYRYLDWQNDQHTIKYEIVQQLHCWSKQTNVRKVYSNRRTKSSLTGYNELTKTNRLIERTRTTTNDTKPIETNWTTNQYELSNEQPRQQCHLFGCFAFAGQLINSE